MAAITSIVTVLRCGRKERLVVLTLSAAGAKWSEKNEGFKGYSEAQLDFISNLPAAVK